MARVPAPVEVNDRGATVPPTIPLKVLTPVDVTVRAYAPLTVEPKSIVPDPVETSVVPAKVTTAPEFTSNVPSEVVV